MMNLHDIARIALGVGLATDAGPVTVTVRDRRVDAVVRDHRVIVESRHGVLRVVWVGQPVGDGPSTRDLRVPIDDADEPVVAGMIRKAVEAGLTPF